MRRRYKILIVLILISGSLGLWMMRPDTLVYKPFAALEGFRELVLHAPASLPNAALIGLPSVAGEDGVEAAGEAGLPVCDALYRDPASPAAGNAQSSLIIVEFFDYRCPYCKVLAEILADIQQSDPGVRVIYKEWPILSESSKLAARAALAAANQGKYVVFHRRIMKAGFIPTQGYLENIAKSFGIDLVQLRKDMVADATTSALRRTARLASAMGLTGTPVLVVGRTIVQSAITRAQLVRLIGDELRSTPPGSC